MHYRATAVPARSLVAAAAARAGSEAAAFGVRAGAVLFAAVLTGAAAQLSVPVPWSAVPFTMQPVAVLLAGAVFGARLGAMSQALYLLFGVTGAAMFALSPVLAPGLARLVGPTGGFLLAFPAAACAVGALADRAWTRTFAGALAAMSAGLGVLYASGAVWLAIVAGPGALATLWVFAASDLVKVAAAAAVLPAAVRALGPRR
ncbi:MAG: biotin transporter BioY [Vicinamibacterales bacterium]